MRTVDPAASRKARLAWDCVGPFTGPPGAGGMPMNTSGNPNLFRNRRTWPRSEGGGGITLSIPRMTADPRIWRARAGNGPAARLRPTNQMASSTATTATSEPPAASTLARREVLATAYRRLPTIHPRASPTAAMARKLTRAMMACVPGLVASFAKSGATVAPTTSPKRSPPNVST